MDNHSSARWQQLLDRLQKDDGPLVETTVSQLLDTIPGYEKVGAEALAFSVRRYIALSIRIIRLGADPSPNEVPEADALANERLSQGVPLGSVLSGFRVSMIMILRRLRSALRSVGGPDGQPLREQRGRPAPTSQVEEGQDIRAVARCRRAAGRIGPAHGGRPPRWSATASHRSGSPGSR
ncbi:hypothetical protein [Corynebacterium pollutisoli]|uniref:hypothetical protein n=1 Tax=Corynebacterium pollutisoli TaxID=1610489 RepID=UPI0011785156|nr:hypothetical protein [Corynebacterium pollutisoli]